MARWRGGWFECFHHSDDGLTAQPAVLKREYGRQIIAGKIVRMLKHCPPIVRLGAVSIGGNGTQD